MSTDKEIKTVEESAANHITVLLNETVEGLNLRPNGIYIDGTFGRGGHSRLILSQLGEQGKLIAIDRDEAAAESAKALLDDPRFEFYRQNFASIEPLLLQKGLIGSIDGVLLDLGVSSPQLDEADRGFSFLRDGPLDMRMDRTRGESAAEWLARAKVEEIKIVLKEYGEEKFATRIARAIVGARETQPIETTLQLVKIIEEATPVKDKFKHPATRSFQAIRIYINRELEELNELLSLLPKILKSGGRMSIISFHSLEDRIVKRFIKNKSRGEQLPKGLPVTEKEIRRELKNIGKAVKASEAEVAINPRSRSAILRIAEKL